MWFNPTKRLGECCDVSRAASAVLCGLDDDNKKPAPPHGGLRYSLYSIRSDATIDAHGAILD